MSLKKLSKLYHYFRCVPKTIFFNLYYLPIKQAIKFPILVNHRTKFVALGGQVKIPKTAKTAKIKLGFGRVQISDSKYSRFIWNISKDGVVELGHHIKIGTGSKLHVQGHLSIGSDSNFTGEATIICNKEIAFGSSSLISWQTLFMDSDLHSITNEQGAQLNENQTIHFGENIWVGARATVLKGVSIGSNSVLSSGAVVTKTFPENSVIGGNPAKVIADFTGKKFTH
ncbi:acyltransferase [Vibrio sp. TBV020]|uniref:acyltransferase n=1 Tax=Vibrio sp. TBV020 TaxID=3137398 RepID=UPI0038CD79F2